MNIYIDKQLLEAARPEHGQVFEGLSDPRVGAAQAVLVQLQRPFIQRQSIAVFLLPSTNHGSQLGFIFGVRSSLVSNIHSNSESHKMGNRFVTSWQ